MSDSTIEKENIASSPSAEPASAQNAAASDAASEQETTLSQSADPPEEASSPQEADHSCKPAKCCWKKTAIAVTLLVVILGLVFFTSRAGDNIAGTGEESPLPVADNTPSPVASAPDFTAADLKAGSYVKIGRYPQNDDDDPEPIEWLVLDNDGKEALLLSKYGLDRKPYHHEKVAISWRDCDLRKWLNSDFLEEAFTADEQLRIADSNTGNAKDEALDKVFCLSLEEAYKYFGNVTENMGCKEKWHSDIEDADWWVNRERSCSPTAYAISHGAVRGKNICKKKGRIKTPEWWINNCLFWLRSPGSSQDRATYVTFSGAAGEAGAPVPANIFAVRPAMRVNVK